MPIDVTLKFKAVSLTSLRLKVDNNWDGQYSLSSKVVSHARFLDQEINKLSIAKNINLIDKTTLTNFANKFTVNMNLPQVAPDDSNIKIYTDGSLRKSLNLTGAGFTMQRNGRTIVEQTIRLGKMATINQSEMFAINQSADLLVSADTQKQVIHFYSDSLSSLLQLNKGYTTSKLTLDTVLILNKLGIQNEVYLHKVAAHTGIPGNERADILAKEGANTPPIGPEPFLSISWSNVINELLLKAKNETLSKLVNHKIKNSSKTPVESYLDRFGPHRLACNKKQSLRILTHMFTDQGWLNHSLSKRNPQASPYCKHCVNIEETAQHFINDCPAYATVRLNIFGVPYISLSQIICEYGPAKLIKFLNKSGRINENYYRHPI